MQIALGNVGVREMLLTYLLAPALAARDPADAVGVDGLPPGVVAQRTRHPERPQFRCERSLAERRSFSLARVSIWRTRSRERWSRSPISWSVCGSPSPSP